MTGDTFPKPAKALLAASASMENRSSLLDRLEAAFTSRDVDVARWNLEERAPSDRPAEDHVVVVYGGDGALMSAIRALDYPETPFFGVNHGRVGFLMNAPEPSDKIAGRIASGEVRRATYPVLEASLELVSGERTTLHAFNDVVIERASGQTAQLDAFIDDVHLNRYSGDGLIVATPGGSTAYSLAAGGPVVHHDVPAMIVTPLNPHRPVQFHSLQFPTVLSLSSVVSVRNLDPKKRPVRCAIDGRSVGEIDGIEVRDAGRRVTLLRTPEYDFIDTLVRKVIGRPEGGESFDGDRGGRDRGAVDG